MAGVSKAHVVITDSLSTLLVNHLRGTGCIPYTTDMKVRLPALNVFYYPDFAVTCDEDFILHPKLIIRPLAKVAECEAKTIRNPFKKWTFARGLLKP